MAKCTDADHSPIEYARAIIREAVQDLSSREVALSDAKDNVFMFVADDGPIMVTVGPAGSQEGDIQAQCKNCRKKTVFGLSMVKVSN